VSVSSDIDKKESTAVSEAASKASAATKKCDKLLVTLCACITCSLKARPELVVSMYSMGFLNHFITLLKRDEPYEKTRALPIVAKCSIRVLRETVRSSAASSSASSTSEATIRSLPLVSTLLSVLRGCARGGGVLQSDDELSVPSAAVGKEEEKRSSDDADDARVILETIRDLFRLRGFASAGGGEMDDDTGTDNGDEPSPSIVDQALKANLIEFLLALLEEEDTHSSTTTLASVRVIKEMSRSRTHEAAIREKLDASAKTWEKYAHQSHMLFAKPRTQDRLLLTASGAGELADRLLLTEGGD